MNPKLTKSQKVLEKPILVFAQDNSKSIIANADSTYFKDFFKDSIFKKLSYLNNQYDVRTIGFGEEITMDSVFDFDNDETNFEKLYDYLNNKFHSVNFTDLVIVSDGIVNSGVDLPYLNLSPNISVNSILIGDTNQYHDLIVKSIKNNKYALSGNKYPIEISIYSNANFKNVEVHLNSKNKLLEKKYVKNLKKGLTKFTFIQNANEKGYKRFNISVKSNSIEKNISNNNGNTTVEVIDYSQKILILSSSIHPDISALNWALEDQLKSKITTSTIEKFDRKISEFDLLIFYKPSESSDLMDVLEKSRSQNIPSLSILGNNLEGEKIDYSLLGLKNSNFKGQNEVSAILNDEFNSFGLEKDWRSIFSSFPPLSIPFSVEYKLLKNSNILLNQSINGIEIDAPLLYFFNSDNTKHGVLIGEGIWKWKMYEFNQNNNAVNFKKFVKKIVQYLKKIENKTRLNVSIDNENFINRPVSVYAEYYNELMELNNDVELVFSYEKEDEKFSKTLISKDKYYELNLDGLSIGEYSYAVAVKSSNNIFKKGTFSVVKSQKEINSTVANHLKIRNLNNKGKSYYLNQINDLINQLKNLGELKQKSHFELKEKALINNKWLLILLLFPIVEWVVRKNQGLK
ncbi:MAG: hypothetical protein P8Q16_02915 [Flavobacteriales bacterium]|nr:hypothetical protein [Flavobacteriales bacterium]